MSELLPELAEYQAKTPAQALDAAAATVRAYCGWHITPSRVETAQVWSAADRRSLFLQTMALTAVGSVVQDGVTLAATTYTFEPYGVVKLTAGSFSQHTRVTVQFTHGYAEWPDDVRDVVLALAQRSISDTRGMVPRVGGAGQSVVVMENYGAQLSDADRVKLRPYVVAGGFA